MIFWKKKSGAEGRFQTHSENRGSISRRFWVTRPQLKADRGQSIRKHNIRHFFLKRKISNLARKISEKRGLGQPTPKNINSKVPFLLSKSTHDSVDSLNYDFPNLDILHFYPSKLTKIAPMHLMRCKTISRDL